MIYLLNRSVFFLLIMLFSVKVWAQNPDSNAYVLRGKVIQKMERMPIENAQVILQLNENETIGAYTDELGDFEFRFSLEKYPLEKTQLAVMQGFETFLFSPKDFEGKYFILCEITAQKSEILCADFKLPPLTKEREQGCTFDVREIRNVSVCPKRVKFFEPVMQAPSHKYTMEAQILNNSNVYLVK